MFLTKFSQCSHSPKKYPFQKTKCEEHKSKHVNCLIKIKKQVKAQTAEHLCVPSWANTNGTHVIFPQARHKTVFQFKIFSPTRFQTCTGPPRLPSRPTSN
eukprot:m.44627 g.44627  ORF g.44627 m.44627 type:complete len:100 (+) comp10933_c0_seq1:156-455(+)